MAKLRCVRLHFCAGMGSKRTRHCSEREGVEEGQQISREMEFVGRLAKELTKESARLWSVLVPRQKRAGSHLSLCRKLDRTGGDTLSLCRGIVSVSPLTCAHLSAPSFTSEPPWGAPITFGVPPLSPQGSVTSGALWGTSRPTQPPQGPLGNASPPAPPL